MKNPVLLTHCDFCQSPLPSQLETQCEVPTVDAVPNSTTSATTTSNCSDVGTEGRYGHYQILRQAGQGGMGIVYQAYDAALQRPVALKVLQLSRTGHYHQQQLLEEARVASSLQHPNIVTVYDISRSEQQSYIVTEWLEGQTLEQYQRRHLTLATKVDLLCQIASGLASAHQAGVIHRDLKPSNLMVCLPELRVKILDFGMASRQRRLQQVAATEGAGLPPMLSSQLHSQWSQHTTAFQIKGTLPYLAPELLQSDIDATPQSDIFAFGVIMYELCYGVHPFLHDSAEQTMQAILQHRVQCAGNGIQLPARLKQLIEQSMSAQSERRPAQMKSVAATLHALYQDLLRREKLGVWYPLLRWQVWAALAPALLGLSLWLGQLSINKDDLLSQGQTLALQPFDNLGGDPAVQQFLQGMALSLSQDLAKIGQHNNQVWVLPPGELASLKDPSLKNIYQQYQTDLIISGTLQHLGATRRLSLNLHNGADGRILKSSELDLPLNGWDQAQREVRHELLQLLNWQQPANLSLSKGSATPDEAYKAYLTGLSYLYRFDYKDNIEKGVSELTQAIRLAPEFTAAKYALLDGYLKMSRRKDLQRWLEPAEQLLRQLPAIADPEQLRLKAELAKVKTEYQAAVGYYQQALVLTPHDADTLAGLAGAFEALNDIRQAEQYWHSAYQQQPNWHFTNLLALFYYRQHQLEKAEALFSKLLAQSPNNTEILQTVGAIQFSQNRYDDALRTFNQAVTQDPSAINYSNVGTVLFYQQRYAEAVRQFELATELNSRSYQLWGNLADSYRWSAQPDQAIRSYRRAIELVNTRLQKAPNRHQLKLNLALYSAKAGLTDAALTALQQVDVDKEPQTMAKAAQVYEICGQRDRALQLLRAALARGYSYQEIRHEPEFKQLSELLPAPATPSSDVDKLS